MIAQHDSALYNETFSAERASSSARQPASTTIAKRDSDRRSETADFHLKDDFEAVKKRNNKLQKIAIPVSLGVGVLLFVQQVVIPNMQNNKTNEVHQMMMRMQEYNAHLKEKTIDFVHKHTQNHGPFYVFTNDTTIHFQYIPNVFLQDFSHSPLVSTSQNDSLEKMLAHPEAIRWYMLAYNKEKQYLFKKKRTLNAADSTQTYVYLTVANPEVMLPSPYGQFSGGRDSIPLTLSFAVPLYAHQSIKENLDDGILGGSKILLSLMWSHPETARFYMAANAEEGEMTTALFHQVVATIKQEWVDLKVDTTGFIIKTFGKDAN